ncbi:MAG: alpha amylase [Lachnospiraceae bacterium]|nr:alpha amylase [Lachnospiraceae bacterium]
MRKRFEKRPLGIVMAAVMAAQLCACGNAQKSDLQETEKSNEPAQETSSAVENTTGERQTETSAAVSGEGENGIEVIDAIEYNYEQELNIIDDNYRNYYEIFVYSFYDSDGDGIGDLNGVTEKLDYIKDMGFNGIWLMPIMQSPTYHKYDVVDYYSIDQEYGTVEDFQAMIEECHKRDINVVIDFVINHSSSQNQWFVDACDYLKGLPEGQEPDLEECPYVDYYHFTKEQVNNDYYQVGGSNWYYEGVFWSEMPDLNLASEALRTELEDISRFWIDLGVDGFRMDAAMHFEENDITFNTETLNWLYNFCTSQNPDFYMVSEVWAGKAIIENYYTSLTPSMFNFDAADAEGRLIKAARGNYKAASFVENMVGYQQDFAGKNPDYIDAPFITNHDMGRVANALMKDANDMKMAGGLLMTMNGSPFVYYGEEIGMSSSGQKDENKRLPMVWSDSDTTGMTNGPGDADKDIVFAFSGVEQQLEDPYSILNYYKRAVRLRNENPEIARGQIEIVEELTEGNQAAITKTYEDSTIGIIYNTSDDALAVELKDTVLADMAIRGYLTLNGEVVTLTDGTLSMPAQSICILK